MSKIRWQQTCCAWHGEYAECATSGGGVARIKRSAHQDDWLVMIFGADGRPVQRDKDGAPVYVQMPESEVLALLLQS